MCDYSLHADVVRNVQIEVVDLISKHELINLDCVRVLDSDRLKLVLCYFNVVSFVSF